MTTPSRKTGLSSPEQGITHDPQSEKGKASPRLANSPTKDEPTTAIAPTVAIAPTTPVANPYSVKKSTVHTDNRFTDIKIFLSIVAD